MPRGSLFVKNQSIRSSESLIPKKGDSQNLSNETKKILPPEIINLTPFNK